MSKNLFFGVPVGVEPTFLLHTRTGYRFIRPAPKRFHTLLLEKASIRHLETFHQFHVIIFFHVWTCTLHLMRIPQVRLYI